MSTLHKAAAVAVAVAFSLAAEAVNTWYVDDAKGRDDGTYDGLSAETPFKTIGKALDSLTVCQSGQKDGDTVYVADGTYYIDTMLTTTNSVRLLSVSGDPKKCIVDAQGKCPCARFPTIGPNGNHSRNFKICGFTFRNGYSTDFSSWETVNKEFSYSAAGLALGANSMVSNCVVENCHRVVSGTDTTTTTRLIAGGGIAIRGYTNKPDVPICRPKPWADLRPGIYGTVVSNCSLFANLTRNSGRTGAGGGGIYCSYALVSNVFVTCCGVSNACTNIDYQDANGGGLYADSGSRVENSVFRKCRVEKVQGSVGWSRDGTFASGGGAWIQGAQDAKALLHDTDVIRDCLFEENEVIGNSSGGLGASGIRVENCTARTNTLVQTIAQTAYLGGSGIKLYGDKASIRGCLVEGNRSEDRYGYAYGAPLELMSGVGIRVTDCLVRNNTGSIYSGVCFTYNITDAFVSNVVVVGNVATNKGGCFAATSTMKSLLLTDSVFVKNRSHTSRTLCGGAEEGIASFSSYHCYSNIVIRNCLFLGNETKATRSWIIGASYGAADFVTGWKPLTLENCSFVGNTNSTGWGTLQSIYFGEPGTEAFQRIKGCVFAYNCYDVKNQPNRAGFSSAVAAGDITYSYCDAYSQGTTCFAIPVTAENHNMSGAKDAETIVDPKFVDAAHDDFRLAKESPLVDAGGPAEPWMGTGSRRGRLDAGDGGYEIARSGTWGVRVVRHAAQPRLRGAGIDMGACEYRPPNGAAVIVK